MLKPRYLKQHSKWISVLVVWLALAVMAPLAVAGATPHDDTGDRPGNGNGASQEAKGGNGGGGGGGAPQGPDLSLTKSASSDSVVAGSELTYTLGGKNKGPGGATGVQVTDNLPSTVTLKSATTSKGSCSGTSTVVCAIGPLAKNESVTITIKVIADQAGTITNTASIGGQQADPRSANNQASVTTLVTSPTPPPGGCTADHVYFLGVVNNGNEPGEPREDFQADMRNFEFFLQTLRGTYCIPDTQATILAFTDEWKDPETGKTLSPYDEASEFNVKSEIARLGAAASQHNDSIFFFFLSSHGIVYTNAGWTGGDSECPLERVAGSLSGLKGGDGESGDFFDCELGTALNAKFAPTTRMFVAVDCSVCGGFSESLTAVSGTIPDNGPVQAGVVGPNRIVMTGCSMTTECFGSDPAEDGAVSYHHMRVVLEQENGCDGWTTPGFPDVQGFDIPVNGEPFRELDNNCTASEWFFAAVWSAYSSGDVIGIQQQFRIKYGSSLTSDIGIR